MGHGRKDADLEPCCLAELCELAKCLRVTAGDRKDQRSGTRCRSRRGDGVAVAADAEVAVLDHCLGRIIIKEGDWHERGIAVRRQHRDGPLPGISCTHVDRSCDPGMLARLEAMAGTPGAAAADHQDVGRAAAADCCGERHGAAHGGHVHEHDHDGHGGNRRGQAGELLKAPCSPGEAVEAEASEGRHRHDGHDDQRQERERQ